MQSQLLRRSLLLLVAIGFGACMSGRRPRPLDAGVDADRPLADSSSGFMQDAVDGPGRDVQPADAMPMPDTRPIPTGLPLPAGVAPPRRLLDAKTRMTGQGTSSCSNQEPASGDGHRWCVFWREATATGGAELWVIDVTEASVNGVPACDGTSSHCQRLTTNLWTGFAFGGPVHPYSHEFYGDTLIYYADAVSGKDQLHRGPVYAWRPGWTQPRRIASTTAVICWAHERLPLVHCVEDLKGDPQKPDTFELRAGPIADKTDLALATVGQIRPYRSTGGNTAWQAQFSPGGDYFFVSTPSPDPAVETLHLLPAADLGRAQPTPFLNDVGLWTVSNDGKRVFFFREEAPDQRGLFVADLPSGANVTKIASKVGDYLVLGQGGQDRGLGFVTTDGDGGQFHLARDPLMPTNTVTLFSYTDILEDVHVSPDARFTGWVNAAFDIRIIRNADLQGCDLNVTAGHAAFEPWFLDSGKLVFWNEDDGTNNDQRDGYFANPDGCQNKRKFATGIGFTIPVGDRAIVFGDERVSSESMVTLKYAPITNGNEWPAAGPIRIRENVDESSVFFAGTKPLLLIFQVKAGGPAEEGTYLFGPAPF